jgi:hypothetical protein
MKTVLAVLAFVAIAILRGLVSEQFQAWLLLLNRRIVRYAASKMGARAQESEEQWLADLEKVPGRLLQFLFALSLLLHARRNYAIERDFDSPDHPQPDHSQNAAVAWIRAHAWWSAVVALVLLLRAYPPGPSYYAAYVVLIPFLGFCALCMGAPFGRLFAWGFERLGFGGRVVVGSLAVPFFASIVTAWSLVPASGHTNTRLRFRAPNRPPTTVIYTPRLATHPTSTVVGRKVLAAKPHKGSARNPEMVVDDNAVPRVLALPGIQTSESLSFPAIEPIPVSLPIRFGLTAIDLAELSIPAPKQPILSGALPPRPAAGRLPAPVGLRIIQDE